MIIDASEWHPGAAPCADVLIIGSGPVGLVVGLSLAQAGHDVVILEAGGKKYADVHKAYEGKASSPLLSAINGYLPESRHRVLGGSSNHWGGWCRPMEPIDFRARAWIPDSGWPINEKDVEPHLRRAIQFLKIAGFDYDDRLRALLSRQPLDLGASSNVETVYYHRCILGNLATTYQDVLSAQSRLRIVLNCPVREIVLAPDGGRVRHLRVGAPPGPERTVCAGRYVLACGAIENARILLASNGVQTRGIGNQYDNVGRYFQEHPHIPLGRVVSWLPEKRLDLYNWFAPEERLNDLEVMGALRIDDSAQQRLALNNSSFTLMRILEPLDMSSKAFEAFYWGCVGCFFPRRGLPPERERERQYSEFKADVSLSQSIAELGGFLDHDMERRPAWQASMLFARTEQRPNRDSRVRLDTERDSSTVRDRTSARGQLRHLAS